MFCTFYMVYFHNKPVYLTLFQRNLTWEHFRINQSIISIESYLGIFQDESVYLALFEYNLTWEYFRINKSIWNYFNGILLGNI